MIPKWDPITQPPIRAWLVSQCAEVRHACAVRCLTNMAKNEQELIERHADPEYWEALARRWLDFDPIRKKATAISYLSRARVGVGLSEGYEGRTW